MNDSSEPILGVMKPFSLLELDTRLTRKRDAILQIPTTANPLISPVHFPASHLGDLGLG